MKTHVTKFKEIKRKWHLIDVDGQILGRQASKIAGLLIGKNKVCYSPNLDCGDYVVVVNADRIRVSGKKAKDKIYYRHSGYPGGLKEISFKQQLKKDPKKIILWSVKNMLPKNKLRKNRLSRLKVFVGKEHGYEDKFKNLKSKN